MQEGAISVEVIAGMEAGELPVSALPNAIVAIANKLVEFEQRFKSPSLSKDHDRDLTMKDLMHETNKSYWAVYDLIRRGLIRRDHSSRKITVRRKDFEEFKKNVTW